SPASATAADRAARTARDRNEEWRFWPGRRKPGWHAPASRLTAGATTDPFAARKDRRKFRVRASWPDPEARRSAPGPAPMRARTRSHPGCRAARKASPPSHESERPHSCREELELLDLGSEQAAQIRPVGQQRRAPIERGDERSYLGDRDRQPRHVVQSERAMTP